MTTDTETDLIVLPDVKDLPDLYMKDGALMDLVTRIQKDVRAHHIDASTAEGRKFATSLSSKVSSSKVLIEKAGKELTEDWRKKTAAVNAVKKEAVEALEALRDEVKAPVKAWEAAETERVRKIQQQMLIFDTDQLTAMSSAAEIKALLNRIEETAVTEEAFAEFTMDAETAKAEAVKKYTADLSVAEGREAQERELAELRAEKAKREAEEEARRAEEARKAEEAAAEEARLARAAAEEETRKKAEEEREKARAAAAQREKEEAERKHQEELAAAKREAEEAADRERARIAEEQRKADEAREKALADEKNRARIRADIIQAMAKIEPRSMPAIVDAMIAGKIPNVKVLV